MGKAKIAVKPHRIRNSFAFSKPLAKRTPWSIADDIERPRRIPKVCEDSEDDIEPPVRQVPPGLRDAADAEEPGASPRVVSLRLARLRFGPQRERDHIELLRFEPHALEDLADCGERDDDSSRLPKGSAQRPPVEAPEAAAMPL